MRLNNITRIVSVCLIVTLCLSFGLRMRAQAPVAQASAITFTTLSDGQTLHQSAGLLVVSAQVSDASGLRSVSLYGDNRAAGVYLRTGSPSTSVGVYWNVGRANVGDYTWTVTAFNVKNQRSDKAITVHLLP